MASSPSLPPSSRTRFTHHSLVGKGPLRPPQTLAGFCGCCLLAQTSVSSPSAGPPSTSIAGTFGGNGGDGGGLGGGGEPGGFGGGEPGAGCAGGLAAMTSGPQQPSLTPVAVGQQSPSKPKGLQVGLSVHAALCAQLEVRANASNTTTFMAHMRFRKHRSHVMRRQQPHEQDLRPRSTKGIRERARGKPWLTLMVALWQCWCGSRFFRPQTCRWGPTAENDVAGPEAGRRVRSGRRDRSHLVGESVSFVLVYLDFRDFVIDIRFHSSFFRVCAVRSVDYASLML